MEYKACILSDWKLRRSNATMLLMCLYRELRKVFNSDLLPIEKEHLFTRMHVDEIHDIGWLVRPDLYLADRDRLRAPCELTRYDHVAGRNRTIDPPHRLRGYLDELSMMLDYEAKVSELRSAIQVQFDMMKLDLPICHVNNQEQCEQRKYELAKGVPRLHAAFEALRLGDGAREPMGGYFWSTSSHQEYIDVLLEKLAVAEGTKT